MTSPWVLAPKPNRPGIGGRLAWAWPERATKTRLRVLVRGRRLDGPGVVRFVVGPHPDTAPLANELRIDTTQVAGSLAGGKWRTLTSDIYVRESGCYGLQLDWAGGSRTLTFKAKRGTT
jgi:hypothetical protein